MGHGGDRPGTAGLREAVTRSFPRPPADGFPGRSVYPELTGKRLADLILIPRQGLGLTCRACGRHVIITPLGIRRLVAAGKTLSVAEFVARAVCGTCGSREIYATMSPREKEDLEPIVVYREYHRGPRHDRGSEAGPLEYPMARGWLDGTGPE